MQFDGQVAADHLHNVNKLNLPIAIKLNEIIK